MKQYDYIVAAVLFLVYCMCVQTTTPMVFAQIFAPDVSTVRLSVSQKNSELINNLVFSLILKYSVSRKLVMMHTELLVIGLEQTKHHQISYMNHHHCA